MKFIYSRYKYHRETFIVALIREVNNDKKYSSGEKRDFQIKVRSNWQRKKWNRKT